MLKTCGVRAKLLALSVRTASCNTNESKLHAVPLSSLRLQVNEDWVLALLEKDGIRLSD